MNFEEARAQMRILDRLGWTAAASSSATLEHEENLELLKLSRLLSAGGSLSS